MQGSGACWPGPQTAQRLKCWRKDGKPASHGTVKLRLRKPSNAPQGQRIGDYGSRPMGLRRNKKLKTRLAGSEPVRVAVQAPGACGPGLQGLAALAPRAWGPAHQITIFRKPPDGKRSRDAGIPPLPPPPVFWAVREKEEGSATIQHAPQGRRTLNPQKAGHPKPKP